MNRIYRLCWNRSLSQWVAASELASCKRSGASRSAVVGHRMMMFSLLSASLGMTGLAHAGNTPTGGQVVAGSGQISQSGNTTTIQQNSRLLSLNWQSFDVGADQTVNFLQPGASSIAVNRILGNTSSEIFGHLNANGQVWLINPNGVLFGQNAQVNVGGIVASTLDLDASTLGSDSVRFSGNGKGKVTNQGSITAANGGYVALIGNQVSNQGVIRAQLGTVALGGGSAVTLTFSDNHLLHLEVNESTLNNLAENRQLIVADGGQVLMTAGARDSLLASAVNNTGTVQARSVQDHDGVITLLGGMEAGTVNVGGTLDASAPNGGNGGQIETSAAHFALAGDARITASAASGKAGTWLIDPDNLTIDQPTATTIATTLQGGTSVTEHTTSTTSTGLGTVTTGGLGDITLLAGADITWTNAASTLTFDSFHDISVNAKINGTGGVNMNATGGTLTIGNAGGISAGTGATVNASKFVNNAGANALGAKWLAYTASPLTNTLGGLTSNYIQYNATLGSTLLGTGNGLIYALAPTLNVTGLTGTVGKVYDSTNAASFTGANFNANGLVNGDTIATATGGSYASVDVASGIAVTSPGAIGNFSITNNAIPVFGYTLGTGPVTGAVGQINAAQLTASIIGTPTKTYDGTTTATLSSGNYLISGLAGGQTITVNQPNTLGYASGEAGDELITAGFKDTNFLAGIGTKLSNYILPTAATGMGHINQANVVLSGILADGKVYDGSALANLDTGNQNLFGIISGDVNNVTLVQGIGSFAAANAGNNLAVSLTGFSLSGTKANDYKLIVPTGLTADITPRALSISGVTATSRNYDATTNDALGIGAATLQGVVAGDESKVSLDGSGAAGTFASPNVGNGIAVTANGFALTGTGTGNYTLTQPTGLFANIAPAPLTITLIGNPTKIYNGTTTADTTAANWQIVGLQGGQGATLDQVSTVNYAGPDAGTNIGVNATLEASDFHTAAGTFMSNYSFSPTVTGTGTIAQAPLTISIVNNPTKVFDNTDAATLNAGNFLISGFLQGQGATVNQAAGTYHDLNEGPPEVNVGQWEVIAALTLANLTANGGTNLNNYTIPSLATGSGQITPIPVGGLILAGLVSATKTYDGLTSISLLPTNFGFTGLMNGDSVAIHFATLSGVFGSKNVGTQPLTAMFGAGDLTVNSAHPEDYTLPTQAFGTGLINPAVLTAKIIGNPTKVYDGTTKISLAPGNYELDGLVPGESGTITPSSQVAFASKDAGSWNIMALLATTSFTPGANTQFSNYILPTEADGPGTITQAPLFITGVSAQNKVYDTTDLAGLNVGGAQLQGLVTADVPDVTLNTTNTGHFATANAGTGIAVTPGAFTLSGSEAANYNLQQPANLFANITPAPLTVSGISIDPSKIYDGTTDVGIHGTAALNGLLGTDAGSVQLLTADADANTRTADVGNNLSVLFGGYSLSGTLAGNYSLSQPASSTINITPRALTATIIGDPTKAYDGSTSTTLTAANYLLNGFVAGQGAMVPQSATANYIDQNAGTNITVNSTLVVSDFVANAGTSLANYILPTTGTGTGTITKAIINLTSSRVYDGTAGADASLFASGGTVAGVDGETVGLAGSANLVNKNVGNQKAFNDFGTLTLVDNGTTRASNYTLVGGTDWVTVTPRALTALFTAQDKEYNGDANAMLLGAALETTNGNRGLVAGDMVSLNNILTGTFSDKNAGTAKTVTGNMTISGDDAGNYVFTQGTTLANITQKHITVDATGHDKEYDGTTTAAVDLDSTDLIGGDNVNFGKGAANFADKNVAGNIGISVTGITASGADAGNYILDNVTASTTANIIPRVINLSGTRIYDGTSTAGAATFNGGTVQGQNGETLSLTGNFTLTSKNVGNYSWMDGGTLMLGDNTGLASNYTLVGGTDTYTVTPRALTASFDADNKTYDGSTVAALENALLQSAAGNQGLIAGDKVTLTNETVGSFDNKNAGVGKTVTGNMGITGDDATNYTFTNATSTADIGKASLTVTAMGTDKTYDGDANDTVTLKGGIAGDNLTFNNTSATFDDKNAGVGKTVTVDGITVGGSDAANYDLLNTTAQTTAAINQVKLNLTGSRTYDGTAGAAASLFGTNGVLTGVNGETLTLTGTGTVSDKNVGSQKSFATGGLDGFGLSGNGGALAGNYTLAGGTDWVTINPKSLTATATVKGRAYDGTTNIALIGAMLSGLVGGDDVVLGNDTMGTFADKNAAIGKAVTTNMTVSGDDAGNYTFTTPTGLTADVTPLTINVVAGAQNKVYDTTTNVTINSLTSNGVLGSDVVNFAFGSAAFDDANAANGKTVTVNGITKSGTDAGNYTINTTAQTNADITRVVLDLSGTRVYDGSTGADASLFGSSGVLAGIGGQTLNLSGSGVAASKNVVTSALFAGLGTLALADGGNGGLANNYTLLGGSDTLTITQKALTATTTVDGRTYDGTANIALIGATLSGLVANDDVVLGNDATGTFADKNVANAKAVTTAMTISGGDMGNYAFTQPTGLTADVTPLMINVVASAQNKVYDTTTNVTINSLTSNGLLGSDVVNFAFGSAAFDDANAANGKTVTVNGITKSGTDAGNYTINTTAQTNADITRVVLDLSGTRVYDGSTGADASLFGSSGVLAGIGGQTLNLSGSGVAASKNVVTSALFAGLGTLALADGGNGGLANNYTLLGGSDTLTITQKALTATTTVNGRAYDGTANIALIGAALSGLVANDDVVLGNDATGTFADKNVANAKAVTTAMTISGGDMGNYAFTQPTGLAADVTPLMITVGATTFDKIYDTNSDATSLTTLNHSGILGGDMVNVAFGSAAFDDANAGNHKTVTVNGITKSGTDAGNYLISATTTTIANITPVLLNLTGTRVYDGGTSADALLFGNNGVLAGIGGQTLNLSGSGVAGSKNVGNNVAFAGLGTLALADGGNGGLAGNYTLVGGGDSLTITPKAITIGATGDDKTYDATTAATVHYTNNGVVGGDDIGFTGTANFAGVNAGNGIGINVSGIAATGADALNYSFNNTAATSASITPVVLDLSGTRVYDGGTGADAALFGANGVLTGINGETVNLAGSGVLNNKNVGNGKPFAGFGSLALGDGGNGGLAGNYTLVGGVDSVTVTPKTITVGATGSDKTYDGNTNAGVTLNGNGVIVGDQVSFTPGSANYAGPNAGTGIAITANGITDSGADAGNYAFNTTASTSGTITPAILDLTGTRTYDGTAGAAASLFGNNGVLTGVNGETLTLTGTGAVSDKNVGSQKGFANGGLNGFGLSGNGAALAGNYTLAGGTDWLSITPAMLAVIGTTATDRAYDGTKIDTLSGSMLSGLFGNDDVTLGNTATGLFDTKNVGNDKSVTTAMTIAGGDVGNYILVQPVGLTANVTPRPVTVNATGTDKYFDGNTTDQVTLGSDGVLAGDQLSFTNQAANFSDSAVGNGKTVTVTGIQGNGADAGNYVIADPTTTTTADIMGGQASSFGVGNDTIAQLQGVVGPSAIDTPYGVADPGTVGSFTGNQKKQHRPLERNRARTDFKSGLALSVVDGGVQMPANEMP